MMNSVEMNEEMMEQVNGGKTYNVGDHVEVKNWLIGTSSGTITGLGIGSNGEYVYQVAMDHWYSLSSSAWYSASDF